MSYSWSKAKFMAILHSLIDSSDKDLIGCYREYLVDSENLFENYSEADEATKNE